MTDPNQPVPPINDPAAPPVPPTAFPPVQTAPPVAPAPNLPPAPPTPPQPYTGGSDVAVAQKSFIATWLFSWLLGSLAVDRFYLGKVGTGIAKLLTFGGFGIWALVDFILVLTGNQRDKQGRPLAGYNENKKMAWIVSGAVIGLSLVISLLTGIVSGMAGLAAIGTITEESGTSTSAPQRDTTKPAEGEKSPAADSAQLAQAQAWAESHYGTFAPVSFSGTADDIITLPVGAVAGIVNATSSGDGLFGISVLDAQGESTGELLVSNVGRPYSGSLLYGLNSFGAAVSLEITADADWTIDLAPASTAPALPSTGSGDGVYLYTGEAGMLSVTHDGEENFIIQEDTGTEFSKSTLINEIGPYSGSTEMSAGPSAIAVKADGTWTVLVR